VEISVVAFVESTGSVMPNPGDVFSPAGVFRRSWEIADIMVDAAA
jgi:hypothetical protein